VTAVGGTTLNSASNARGWAESAWSGAGAGCSAYESKPTWQHDAGCGNRTVADVSAVADPSTGVAIYDTYGGTAGNPTLCALVGLDCPQPTGWFVVGGTSVSSPIVASVYALSGNASSVVAGSYPYSHTGSLNDVTTGSDGGGSTGLLGLFGTANCGSYLCNAGPGYDGPTGLGTPNGTGAF
jgi:subtilase family serine protease